jgi:hypothetical protein
MCNKKQNNSRTGHRWEIFIWAYVLIGSILETRKNRNHVWDITYEGLRFNVKAAKLRQYKHGKYFRWKLDGGRDTCDFFVLVGYHTWRDRVPLKIYIIAADYWEKDYLYIGPNHRGHLKQFEKEIPIIPIKGAASNEVK